jgi:hypothetical protein
MRGEVLHADSPGYDEARAVWNALFDRRPAVIARCAGVADVIAAVDFARANAMEVSVRRRPFSDGLRHVRRRARDRPVADEGHQGRP